jgi:hypothetical protein
MHVKALGRSRKHPGSGKLPGPKTKLRKNAFIAPDKFAKKSTVPLRVNFSGENFHTWYPRGLNFALVSIRSSEIAGVYATLGKLIGEGRIAVISGV